MSARKLTNIQSYNIPINKGKYSAKNIFNSYITVDELKKHPELYHSLKREKKLILDVLPQKKPKKINTKGIQSENKSKIANKLNSFYKVFFDYYKHQKNTMEDTYILNQENKDFMKKYKKSSKSNEINKNRNNFSEIKEKYEKKDYYVADLDSNKNLFNGNILLANKNELKNYILYDLGTPKGNDKSIAFLYKINKKLGDKTSDKPLNLIYARLNMEKYNKDKKEKDYEDDIVNTKKDILNTKQTINSMDNIDNYFKTNTKKDLLNLHLDNKSNNDINNNKILSRNPVRHNSAYYLSENEKNENIISKSVSKQFINRSSVDFLKKYNNDENKNDKLKLSINDIDNRFNKYISQQSKTIENNGLHCSLENLYDKMSTKEDLLKYQPEIKNYLLHKKFDVSVRLNPTIVCNNFEKTREKICTSDFLKNNIQLRKQMGNIESKVEEINNNDIKAMNKMNKIEDKMIKLFCDINNPKPKN